jgi:GNAT superfamily N-acetyltransferase
MSITLRAGSAADRDFVIETARRLAAFGPPPWRSAMEVVAGEVRCLDDFFDGRLAGRTLLVAELDAAPGGFALLEPAVDYFTGEPHGHLGIVAVTAAAEGRGVGAALLQAAEEWARTRGYRMLTLNVFEGNRHARQVYERFGYAVETVRYVKAVSG